MSTIIAPPKYKVGDILRYSYGPTALMKVTFISPNHGGAVRYYGQQCFGGAMGAYEDSCSPASPTDLAMWESKSDGQAEPAAVLFTREAVGIVED